MSNAGPTRTSADLADVVELLLDKGLVINADIAVSVGDTELLGIQIRAAVASFETAAQYGLAFPDGTDQERIEAVAERGRLASETADDAVGCRGVDPADSHSARPPDSLQRASDTPDREEPREPAPDLTGEDDDEN